MVDPLQIAKSLVEPAVRLLLADRRRRTEQSLPLAELINVSLADDYKRRKLQREIEAIRDTVAQRLERLCQHELAGLTKEDRQATLNAIVDTFDHADLSDEAFFSTDADPVKLARQLRARLPRIHHQARLSEEAQALYDRLLDECCVVYVRLITHLAAFVPRGISELLDRTTSISEQVELILTRLPIQNLNGTSGTEDNEFRERYLTFISETLDELDLFGLDVRSFSPRTSLSVAYISLAVSATEDNHVPRELRWDQRSLTSAMPPDEHPSLRVEQALGRGPRALIRGEAGSGKTTLLRWLAVNAARGGFTSSLATWNGLVPFLVKLRSHAGRRLPSPEQFLEGTADSIAGLMPERWVHRQMESGQALLLVDGVDELSTGERSRVRDWLRGVIKAYPKVFVVVTSRPAAAAPRWLVSENFFPATLERMGPTDVRELIAHWHKAIRESSNLPCDETDIAAYERSLLAQLDANSHLHGLATNPLLCAMLCALNLDRRKALPRDRMAIYEAALDMLLDRRDAERAVPSHTELVLDIRTKLYLVQYLAWRLSYNNRAEMSRDEAARRLADRLATMSISSHDPKKVLDYLIHRSGVIREPSIGRVDFVHRTFQEYLTARETAEQDDVGFLIERAHLDTWRETIVMAAGHANKRIRHNLLEDLLTRAEMEPSHRRKLRILVAACLETAGPLDPQLRYRIEQHLAELLPPRRLEEARSLVSAGPILLRHAPQDLTRLSFPAASSVVHAIALIGGPDAIELLAKYTSDPRLRRRIQESSKYFEPREYARRILTKLLKFDQPLWILDGELDAWRHVEQLPDIHYLAIQDVEDLGEVLTGLPAIRELWARGPVTDLSPLTRFSESLGKFTLWSGSSIRDFTPLTELPLLSELVLGQATSLQDVQFLSLTPRLRNLWLRDLSEVKEFSPLFGLKELEELRLYAPLPLRSFKPLAQLPALRHLGLVGLEPPGGLRRLAAILPNLERLDLFYDDCAINLCGLTELEGLKEVFIESSDVSNLEPLRNMKNLEEIDLSCPEVVDLAPIAELPRLKILRVRRPSLPDLSPFRGRTIKIYVWNSRAYRRWRGKLERGARVINQLQRGYW